MSTWQATEPVACQVDIDIAKKGLHAYIFYYAESEKLFAA